MALTAPQRRALTYLASVKSATPSMIGDAMDDGTYKHGHGLKAQGAGRLGGTMAWRLRAKGYVASTMDRFTRYEITPAGRKALTDGL